MSRTDQVIRDVEELCAIVLGGDPESDAAILANRILRQTPLLRRSRLDARSLEHIRLAHENLRALGAHLNLEQMPKVVEG